MIAEAATAAVLVLAGSPAVLSAAHSSAERYPIKVYFYKHQNPDGTARLEPVRRWSPDLGVARFALEQLLAGPTAAERAKGLHGGLRDTLRGPSNCGEDFTVEIRRGVLTVRFCRHVNVTAGTSMVVSPQVAATLRQFPTVQRLDLLGKDGSCTFSQADDCPTW